MKTMKPFCLVAIAMLCLAPSLPAQPAGALGAQPGDATNSGDTIVYPVRGGAAADLAQTLAVLFPEAHIVHAAESNVVLLRVGADLRETILRVLSQLDGPPRAIVVRAYLLRSHGEALSADEAAGLSGPRDEVLARIAALRDNDRLAIEHRIELTTLENQKALVQAGQQVSVVTGSTITSTRTRANNYQWMETGTLFSVAARLTPDNAVLMEITFEKSSVDAPTSPSDEEATPAPAGISKLICQTTVQCPHGQAVLAGGMVVTPTASSGDAYLVVMASKVDGATRRPAVAARPAVGSDPFVAPRPTRSPRTPQADQGDRPASGGGFPNSAERFESFVKSAFSRADRDGDGVLSEEEWTAVAGGRFRDDFKKHDAVTLDVYRRVLTARMQGIVAPRETNSPTQPNRSENPQPNRSEAPQLGIDSIHARYATQQMEQYDGDGDGKLNADERSKMTFNPAAADVDSDGFVTKEELMQWYSKPSPRPPR